jgi:hypothetical protein
MTKPFTGTINMDVQEAVPGWGPYEQPRAPQDAPNGCAAPEVMNGYTQSPVEGVSMACSVDHPAAPSTRRHTPFDDGDCVDRLDGSLWHGWSVQTHSGVKVGSVKGHFDTGPYAGQLRVHQARADGTAVFAIPVGAVAASGNGRIVLTHSAPPALTDWLAYLIRRYGMVPTSSP